MATWLFQANPDRFDIDGYFAAREGTEISFRVSRYSRQIRVGDSAYFWRAMGRETRARAGVIAAGMVTAAPRVQPDDPQALPYWRTPAEGAAMRIWAGLNEVAVDDTLLAKEVIERDTVLSQFPVFRLRNQTVYRLPEDQARRLGELWRELHPFRAAATPRTPFSGAARATAYRDYGPAPRDDPAELRSFARRVRRGQFAFRQALLAIYDGRCCISGWSPEEALEAAHIEEHAAAGLNSVENGLLLRSDLHVLFDEGLLCIDPDTLKVVLAPNLRETPYSAFDGVTLRPPDHGPGPSTDLLSRRWEAHHRR